MTEWHPLRCQNSNVSATWKELDRYAEERGRLCESAKMPSLEHATLQDYAHVYEPSDDTYLLLDGILADVDTQSMDVVDGKATTDAWNILEIGTGSGVPITYLAQQLLQRNYPNVHVMATDINPKALAFAQKTASENKVPLTTVQCDLATALLPDFAGKMDVVIFNPPYVPTPDDEVAGNGIEVSWAGGERGRRVVDRALPQIAQLLARPHGVCYMITVDDNEPEEIAKILQSKQYNNLTMTPLLRRRAHNEYLTVQKITCAESSMR
jgi:release factor glutamine methyltransferase